MNKNNFAAIAGVFLLLIAGMAVIPLDDDPLSDLHGSIIGDHIKSIDYDDTATYKILVKNEGDYNAVLDLSLVGVPEHWTASLDEDHFTLAGESHKIVILSVNSPSSGYSGVRGIDTIASVGVRGDNITVGTITIVTGTATVTRAGVTTSLTTDDEIQTGDIITNTGLSTIAIDPSALINGTSIYSGTIFVNMWNAKIGFLRSNDIAYMTYMSGEVTIYVPGGGGGTRQGDNGLTINLSQNDDVDTAFPHEIINIILEFASVGPASDALIHLGGSTGDTEVKVYEGSVNVVTDVDKQILEKFKVTKPKKDQAVPAPTSINNIIVIVKNDDVVETSLESGGKNVTELADCYYIPIPGYQYYVVPSDTPDLELKVDGRKEGSYEASIVTVTGNTARTFKVDTTTKETTKETIVISENKIELKDFDEDKTYDLTIAEEDTTTGDTTEFELEGVKTSEDDQSFEVKDWEKIDDENEKPVTMTDGDAKVDVGTGTDADKIEDEIAEAKEDEFDYWPIMIGGIFIIILLVVISFYFVSYHEVEGDLKVDHIEVDPKEPSNGEQSQIRVRIKNLGSALKGDKNQVTVTFYDDYDTIEEKKIDLDSSFESGDERIMICTWTPDFVGVHTINVAVDIDDTESDVDSVNVQVKGTEDE